jgi:beta-glucosidase
MALRFAWETPSQRRHNLMNAVEAAKGASDRDVLVRDARQFPGVDGELDYDEGIYVGYRWFDKQAIKLLFGFGYGLSYTQFEYSNAHVTPIDGGYRVTFTVTNTGEYQGDDVPQVYLGAPEMAPAPVAVKSLVGFKRLSLSPGQSKTVSVVLSRHKFEYWDMSHHSWQLMPGQRPLLIGHSSQDYQKIATVSVATE